MLNEWIEELPVAKLTVQLTDIPDEGLDLVEEVQPDELGLSAEEALLRGPISLSANLIKVGAHVHVEGVMEGTFVWECVRCLNAFNKPTEILFTAEYALPASSSKSRGRAVKDRRQESAGHAQSVDAQSPDHDEVYVCAGEGVELSEMLREHIILWTPMQPLCREQCLGLCPVCGQNRNEQPCKCIEATGKNPFALLQERLKHRDF